MTATGNRPLVSVPTGRDAPPQDPSSADTFQLVTCSARVVRCSWRLYDAECAAHAAPQSNVREWIEAADSKLHDAVVDYESAVAARHEIVAAD